MNAQALILVTAAWAALGAILLARPEWIARLRGEDPAIVGTRPIAGWLTYGATLRLGGAVLLVMAAFLAAIAIYGQS